MKLKPPRVNVWEREKLCVDSLQKEKLRKSELKINSIENVYLEHHDANGRIYRSTIFLELRAPFLLA